MTTELIVGMTARKAGEYILKKLRSKKKKTAKPAVETKPGTYAEEGEKVKETIKKRKKTRKEVMDELFKDQ